MRTWRSLTVAALGIAVAVALWIPAGGAGAATRAQAKAQSHAAGTAVIGVSLKADTPARPGAVDPECVLFYMNAQGNPGGGAHISTFLYKKHNIRAVKINAKIQCRRVSMHLVLRVTLWKTGLLFPHKQAGPTQATAAKGNQLKNQMTWRQCKNTTNSTFYGTAFASVVFQGVTYSNSLQSKNATLNCGT
jgi:hypothetical protein